MREGRVGTRSFAALIALVGGLAFTAPASAATIGVPQDYPTIQDAVDNADTGDTIAVSKKTNIESVEVGTQNLTIKGVGKGVIVDGFDGSDDFQFEALADGLRVKNLEMRNGSGFDCTGYDRCAVDRVSFTGDQSTYCFSAAGNKASVTNSSLRACGSNGVSISGNDSVVTGNRIKRTDSACVSISGDDARVAGNTMRGCEDGDAIYVSGNRALAEDNKAESVDGSIVEISGDDARILDNRGGITSDDCYEINGADAKVSGNKGSGCGSSGIDLTGDDAQVNNNSIVGADGYGVSVSCQSSCEDTEVVGNDVQKTVEDDYGVYVSVGGSGSALIAENTVFGTTDDGFSLSLDAARIRDNVVRDSGNEHEEGFDISGSDNVLTGNRALGNGGDGFAIDGGDNVLRNNVANGNDGDGFYVSAGNGNALVSNTANANAADGFENDGTGTVVRQNEAARNRRDCANDGTIAEEQGNACADGSDFDEPGTASRRR